MKAKVLLFLKGVAMGAADVVPGVSGGTIAFISGIYEELLASINAVDLAAFRLLARFDLKGFWSKINGNFLSVLLFGIATAVVSMAKIILYLLENQPILVWSFFFGLIVASALLVARQLKQWSIIPIIALLAGTALAYYITTLQTIADESTSLLYIFLCGSVAICAMILPGISGSFILLLMGAYQLVIGSLKGFIDSLVGGAFEAAWGYFQTLFVFLLGCVVGLLSFARLLSFMYKQYHDVMIAVLIGFLIGSLNKVWPWKETLSTYIDRHGIEKPLAQSNVSPFHFEKISEQPSLLPYAILLAIVGFFIVFGLERFAASKPNKLNAPETADSKD